MKRITAELFPKHLPRKIKHCIENKVTPSTIKELQDVAKSLKTQLLTGQRQFNAYFIKMGSHSTPTSKHCPDKIDDAENTFFEFDWCKDNRSSTDGTIGTTLSPKNLTACMVRKENKWSALAAYAQRLLEEKTVERDQLPGVGVISE